MKREPSKTLQSIFAELEAREEVGLGKYPGTVDREDLKLSQWARHAYEESLDKAVYSRRVLDYAIRMEEVLATVIVNLSRAEERYGRLNTKGCIALRKLCESAIRGEKLDYSEFGMNWKEEDESNG